MHFAHAEHAARVYKMLHEQLKEVGCFEFFVPFVRNAFGDFAHAVAHVRGQLQAVTAFEHVPDAPSSRLRIDADNVGVVFAPHVFGIDGKVGHVPLGQPRFLAEIHAFCDRVLMRTRKRREHQFPRVRLTGRNLHARKFFVRGGKIGHIRKIQPRLHPLRIHVHGERDKIAVARALAVSEQRAFHAIGARKQSEFRRRHARSSIVMRVQRKHDRIAVAHVLRDIGDLLRIDMRHGVFHRGGKIDDRLAFGHGLPHVEHGIDDFERVFGFGAREAFGRILEAVRRALFFRQTLQKRRAFDGDLFDLLFPLPEHLFALRGRSGIIDVHDHVFRAAHRLERALDDMRTRLRQHLNGHVVGDPAALDERAQKFVFRFTCRGKPDFDFLKADCNEQIEEIELGLQIHRLDERLIAVAQIHTAPHGRAFHGVFFQPTKIFFRGHEELFAIFCAHINLLQNKNRHLFLRDACARYHSTCGQSPPLFSV